MSGCLLPCLPGSSCGCGGRRHFGGRAARLWLVQTASEDVADPYGRERGTYHDQYPVVPHEILVNHHRRGGCGERCQSAPGSVVYGVSYRGGPHAAGVDPEEAEDEAGSNDAPYKQWHDDQLVARRMVERVKAKIGGSEDITPFALRVTMIFRPEEGIWKIVHRHADPITTAQSAESVIQE